MLIGKKVEVAKTLIYILLPYICHYCDFIKFNSHRIG